MKVAKVTARILHLGLAISLLGTHCGCNRGPFDNTTTSSVSADTQSDLDHNHKHFHGDPHRHDHTHDGDFVGAHQHPHEHGHRHFSTPHGGHLIHLERVPSNPEGRFERELEEFLHLEAVVNRDRLKIYPIVESESGQFDQVALAVETASVSLKLGDVQRQVELKKSANHEGYECKMPESLISDLDSVDVKSVLKIENISIGNLTSRRPEIISIPPVTLDSELD